MPIDGSFVRSVVGPSNTYLIPLVVCHTLNHKLRLWRTSICCVRKTHRID